MNSPGFKYLVRFAAFAIFLFSIALSAGCSKDPISPKLPLAEQLQEALDNARASYDLIGVSAAVIVPGQEIWTGASGFSRPPNKMRPDMLFGIGSVTKTFTAALILKLAEEGLLSLDDSLHQWLPSFQNIDSTITIRQLLNHTSGIFDFLNDGFDDFWSAVAADLTKVWTPEEILTFVKEPHFPPGSSWKYSNTNYILLGMIIKEVTGSQVSTELRNRLLNPLNLHSTFLDVEETISGEVAHNWSDGFDGDGTLDDISSLPRTAMFSMAWTAGAMFSTAEEVARFANALYGGEVLSQAYHNQMLTFYPVTSSPFGPAVTGYGLGTARATLSGKELWGHGGNLGPYGYTALVGYSPEDRVTIALLFNHDFDYEIRFSIFAALLNVVLDFQKAS